MLLLTGGGLFAGSLTGCGQTPRGARMSRFRYGRCTGLLLTAGLMSSVAAAPRPFSGSKAGDERDVGGLKLCWCPAGKFRMGSPPREPERRPDEAQVAVTLTKGFWMGKYEVTRAQWKKVVGRFPR